MMKTMIPPQVGMRLRTLQKEKKGQKKEKDQKKKKEKKEKEKEKKSVRKKKREFFFRIYLDSIS